MYIPGDDTVVDADIDGSSNILDNNSNSNNNNNNDDDSDSNNSITNSNNNNLYKRLYSYIIEPGIAVKSYGIEAAQLAHMPMDITTRARYWLNSIDMNTHTHTNTHATTYTNGEISYSEEIYNTNGEISRCGANPNTNAIAYTNGEKDIGELSNSGGKINPGEISNTKENEIYKKQLQQQLYVYNAIKQIDLNKTSPMEAFRFLHDLQDKNKN